VNNEDRDPAALAFGASFSSLDDSADDSSEEERSGEILS
jgi:hypothetical protein